MVPKKSKKKSFRIFLTSILLQYIKNWRGPFGDVKKFAQAEKGESLTVPKKSEKWDPFPLEWFCISCRLWVRSKSSTKYLW